MQVSRSPTINVMAVLSLQTSTSTPKPTATVEVSSNLDQKIVLLNNSLRQKQCNFLLHGRALRRICPAAIVTSTWEQKIFRIHTR